MSTRDGFMFSVGESATISRYIHIPQGNSVEINEVDYTLVACEPEGIRVVPFIEDHVPFNNQRDFSKEKTDVIPWMDIHALHLY